MSRYSLQTVTPFLPILVELGPRDGVKDAHGRANFLPGDKADLWVRDIKGRDIKKRGLQDIFGKEIDLYLGVIQLKKAINDGDELAIHSVSEKLRPWIADFAEIPNLVLEIDRAAKRASLRRLGINRRYSALLDYLGVMADMLGKARLVMWYSDVAEKVLPALYCPDWRTAAFVMLAAGDLRVCPKCNSVFIPATEKQDYCTPAHGVAYRTARSRWRAKQKSR